MAFFFKPRRKATREARPRYSLEWNGSNIERAPNEAGTKARKKVSSVLFEGSKTKKAASETFGRVGALAFYEVIK